MSIALSLFQSLMDRTLQYTMCCIDDILTKSSPGNHLKIFYYLLSRLKNVKKRI